MSDLVVGVRPAEAEILAALASGERGRTLGELADETRLLPVAVRAVLRELRGRGLVWCPSAGRWCLSRVGEGRR